jgi:hypothetical protein
METEFAGGPVDGGTIPALIFSDVVSAWDGLQASRGADDTSTDTTSTTEGYVPPATTTDTYVPPATTTTPAPVAPAPTEAAPAPATPEQPAPPATGTGGTDAGGTVP